MLVLRIDLRRRVLLLLVLECLLDELELVLLVLLDGGVKVRLLEQTRQIANLALDRRRGVVARGTARRGRLRGDGSGGATKAALGKRNDLLAIARRTQTALLTLLVGTTETVRT